MIRDNKQNILIAGVTGNIGSYLYKNFESKDNIFLIGRSHQNMKNYSQIDFDNDKQIYSFFKTSVKFDALIFLIGLAHHKGNDNTFHNHYYTNFHILNKILKSSKSCKKKPHKIIYASTISIYGEDYKSEFFYENYQANPISPYAVTKKKSEDLLTKNYKKSSWILRFGPVYGKNFMLNIKRRTEIFGFPYRIGSGMKKISLCNIKNIGICINAIISNKVPAGIYNLTDSKEYFYNDLLRFKNKKHSIRVPIFFVKVIYFLAKKFRLTSLKENSIKLLTNNIYSSSKLQKFIDLPFILEKK